VYLGVFSRIQLTKRVLSFDTESPHFYSESAKFFVNFLFGKVRNLAL
jgi:hypothetical protein